MVAGVLTALTSGLSESEALRYGLAAGAATAMTSGSDIGQRADFDALLPQARVQPLS
jgi:fructose-1-phosphate kinase PfkB-like protein